MKLLKAILIGSVVVFLTFITMKFIIGNLVKMLILMGVGFIALVIEIISYLLLLALIGLAAMVLWKMFGPKGSKRAESSEGQSKLQTPEMTLDEYKRRLEAHLKQGSEKRP